MANTGKFYPFNRYINDIALLLDGTYKIIPSKYILLKKLKNKPTPESDSESDTQTEEGTRSVVPLQSSGVVQSVHTPPANWNWPEDVADYINNLAKSNVDSSGNINYKMFRQEALDFLLRDDVSTPNDTKDNYKYYIGGDINFISHDAYDGMLYSEIYLHIPNDAGQYRVRVNDTNQDRDVNVLTEPETFNNGTIRTYSFQGVLMFYNIYATGSNEPLACDIPLGVFVLFNENDVITSQELIIQSDNLMGNGTAWSTRICSRFVSSAAIQDNLPIRPGQSNYNTLTSLLSEFGKAIKIMEKNVSSREEDMLVIKSYLDNFKHSQTVNVPYVQGDWWYVNGRPIRSVDQLELLTSYSNKYTTMRAVDMRWPEQSGAADTMDFTAYINSLSDYAAADLTAFLINFCKGDSMNGLYLGTNGRLNIAKNKDKKSGVIGLECRDNNLTHKLFKTWEYTTSNGDDGINYNANDQIITISIKENTDD